METIDDIQTSAQREARRAASARAAVPNDPVLRRVAVGGLLWLGAYAVATALLSGSEHGSLILGDIVYLLPVAVAATLTCMAARRATGRHRTLWRLMAVSNLCWLAGEMTWSFYEIVLGRETPFPSLADAFYLAAVSIVLPAILVGFRSPLKTYSWRGCLDASVAMIALGVTGYRFLVAPQLSDGVSLATFTSIAYPLLDVAVLILLSSVAFSGNRFVPRSVTMVGLAFGATAITDAVYTHLSTVHEYSTGGWLDLGWQLEAVLMCLAALTALRHREGDAVTERIPRDLGLPLMLIGASVAFGTMLLDAWDGRIKFSSAIMACFAVVAMVLRLVLTSRERKTIATRLQRSLDEQERIAVTDPLTGLHNRRFFEEILRIEWERATRSGEPLGILVLDVDRFKSINDEHGHQSGDAVLVQVAARLRAVCRPSDVLARYGGEEFVVIMVGADTQTLFDIAERFRRIIADIPFQLMDGRRRMVTTSVGGAARPDHATSAQELMRIADRALYTAKDAGRNRVVVGRVGADAPIDPTARRGDEGLLLLERLADEVDGMVSEAPHSRVMAAWAATVCEAIGLDAGVTRRTMLGARLHDVGKLVIPRAILSKTGRLTEEEWTEIRRHPSEGRRLVSLDPARRAIAQIIEQHHERWDGAGYPYGLSGTDIAVEARIISVCDAWAAMRADRPYRAALTVEQSRAQLEAGAGSQFDPAVVTVFLSLEASGAVGHMPVVTHPEAHSA